MSAAPARSSFPAIQLTGAGGYQSSSLVSLFQPHAAFFNVVGSLTQPIFDGGRILGNFEFTKARQDELLQIYRKTVIQSFADVDNALVAIRETTNRLRLQRDVLAASRRAFQLSEQQLARRHGGHRNCAKYAIDVIPGGRFAVAGPAGPAAGDRQPVSGAGGRLGAQDGKAGRCSLSRIWTPRRPPARASRAASARRMVSITLTLVILGGLGYIGWTVRAAEADRRQRGGGMPRDLPVPVLAATPRVQDVPVYLDGVGSVRALNNVIVRAQVDGKLISVNFTEGQDVKKGDVLGEIDPVIYKAQYDQAVAKKAQDEAQLANMRLDLARYQQLAASNAGSKQQADTQRAVVAQQEALVNADQAAIDNAAGDARLHQDHRAIVGPRRPAAGRPGQHHPRFRR